MKKKEKEVKIHKISCKFFSYCNCILVMEYRNFCFFYSCKIFGAQSATVFMGLTKKIKIKTLSIGLHQPDFSSMAKIKRLLHLLTQI